MKTHQPLHYTCSPPSSKSQQKVCYFAMNSLLNKESFWLRPYHKLTA